MRMTFLIIIPIGILLWYMIDMPGKSFQGPLENTTKAEQDLADQIFTHVRAIASKEHNTQHPKALEEAAHYIEAQLSGMGYTVAQQIFECEDGQVRNIEVEVKGSTKPSEIVIVGAHYDSARGAPGANDNGSGTAMVLELARSFKTGQPERTLRFVFFTNEEPPYFGSEAMGSLVYANRSRERKENIVAMLSLETVGYYVESTDSQKYPIIFKPFFPSSGNFVAFVGDLKSRALIHRTISTFRSEQKFPSEGIAAFSWIKGIDWSDHSGFWKNDYLALMITDTAIFRYPHYHTHQDTPDQLNYQQMAKVINGIRAVVEDLSGSSDSNKTRL
jgi:Zn-dependent M28 family amino/carboxypeptidase